MEPERINRAMDRIAAAAERIAASARNAAQPAADSDLERRHQRLRENAASALEELDQLLLALEQ